MLVPPPEDSLSAARFLLATMMSGFSSGVFEDEDGACGSAQEMEQGHKHEHEHGLGQQGTQYGSV